MPTVGLCNFLYSSSQIMSDACPCPEQKLLCKTHLNSLILPEGFDKNSSHCKQNHSTSTMHDMTNERLRCDYYQSNKIWRWSCLSTGISTCCNAALKVIQLIYNYRNIRSILTSLHAPSKRVVHQAGDHGKYSSMFLQSVQAAQCRLMHMPLM